MLSVKDSLLLKIKKYESIKFVSWTSLPIDESLSYCLAGLRYSPFAYLTVICLYPFIRFILKDAENFYKTLYQSRDSDQEDIDLEEYVKMNDMKTLSDDQANNLEGLLAYKEISKTLYNMKNEKSQGISGFAAEFFKVFWKDIGQFQLRSLNYGYMKGELSNSQKQGVITCIPKGNKPKLYLKNWRPITLLDTVYKIASGSIANRIKPNLDSLIDKDQTGFIQGRYMGENTRLLYDLINHTEQKEIPGLLLLIDFEKAFDSLSWSFIRKALKFLNFGESFRRWIDVFL